MLTGLFELTRLFHQLYYLDSVSHLSVALSAPFLSLVQALIYYCSSVEGNAIIITACVPGLRPFIKYLRQKINSSQLPSPIHTPKKSNRNSEITVPGSSVSLNRTDERCPRLPNHKEQATTTEETNPKAKKEGVSIRIAPEAEDVEKQAFEKWRESEDTRWNTEEAETSFGSLSSKRGGQNDAS